MRAVKRAQGAPSQPTLSQARTRGPSGLGRLAGAADAPASASLTQRLAPRTRAPRREYRRWDGSLMSGRLRGWRP